MYAYIISQRREGKGAEWTVSQADLVEFVI